MKLRSLVAPVSAAVLAAAATAGAARLAAPTPIVAAGDAGAASVVRAHRFELVDGAGAVRAVLAADVANGGSGLVVLDEAGRARASVGQVPGGGYGLGVLDERGTPRAGIGVGGGPSEGFAGINVRDGAGRIRANLFARDDETQAGFNVWDASRQRSARLGLFEGDDAPALRFLDGQGAPVWQAP